MKIPSLASFPVFLRHFRRPFRIAKAQLGNIPTIWNLSLSIEILTPTQVMNIWLLSWKFYFRRHFQSFHAISGAHWAFLKHPWATPQRHNTFPSLLLALSRSIWWKFSFHHENSISASFPVFWRRYRAGKSMNHQHSCSHHHSGSVEGDNRCQNGRHSFMHTL